MPQNQNRQRDAMQVVAQNPEALVSLLKLYADTLSSASARARWVIVLIVTTSILVFTAHWNAGDSSWMRLRIARLEQIQRYGMYEPPIDGKYSGQIELERDLSSGRITPPAVGQLEDFARFLGFLPEKSAQSGDGTGLGPPTQHTAEMANAHRRQLRTMLAATRHAFREHVMLVAIPFFGTVVDVNDLGVLSGVAFVLLFLMYWFCVVREYDTLKYMFAAAREYRVEIGSIYNVLGSTQVLEVPPTTFNQPNFLRWSLNKFILIPPIVIHGWIWTTNIATIDAGFHLSRTVTIWNLVACTLLFGLLVALAVSCWSVLLDISTTWKTEFVEVVQGRRREDTGTDRG